MLLISYWSELFLCKYSGKKTVSAVGQSVVGEENKAPGSGSAKGIISAGSKSGSRSPSAWSNTSSISPPPVRYTYKTVHFPL